MTAPTSDRAQRAKDIAALSRRCRGALFSGNGDDLAAAVVAYVDTLTLDTERLAAAGEKDVKAAEGLHADFDENFVLAIRKVLDAVAPEWVTLSHRSLPGDAVAAIRQLAADKEKAEREREDARATAAYAEKLCNDLTKRAEAAELGVNAWKETAERAQNTAQSAINEAKTAQKLASEVMDEAKQLRAQLAAMTQREQTVTWANSYEWSMTARWIGDCYVVIATRDTNREVKTFADVDDLICYYATARPHRAALEALRHPAPSVEKQEPERWAAYGLYGKFRSTYASVDEAIRSQVDPVQVFPLYTHPAPAARVVGKMLVVQKGETRTVSSTWNDEMLTTPPDVGTYALSITPNADGGK